MHLRRARHPPASRTASGAPPAPLARSVNEKCVRVCVRVCEKCVRVCVRVCAHARGAPDAYGGLAQGHAAVGGQSTAFQRGPAAAAAAAAAAAGKPRRSFPQPALAGPWQPSAPTPAAAGGGCGGGDAAGTWLEDCAAPGAGGGGGSSGGDSSTAEDLLLEAVRVG
jgi:hypothetical protein